ncbi:MAG: aldehyde ferredoxin oxidoreductase family protein [Desulforhopalus sp.]
MAKILRVRLDTKTYEIAPMPDKYRNLGGRGLTSRIISQEVPPKCDPLGRENKLVFAPGILAGSVVPNSGRISVGAKSPLTSGIKEANAGGAAAHMLARLGLQAIVLEGCAEDWTALKVDKDGITFLPADHFKMKGIKSCTDSIRQNHGDSVSVIAIGQGGEMELKAAGIAITSPDHFPRMAARGGLGAVMGSKKVKLIVVDDSGCKPPEVKNNDLLKVSVNAFTKGITSHPLAGGLKRFGTPMLVGLLNELGGLSTKNFSQGTFAGAEKISGEYIDELLDSRPNSNNSHRCMTGCVISCSNVYTDSEGQVVVSGLEYETLALMGANCMIDDVDIIAAMNAVCNDYGLDTMDVGGAISVAMEAGILPWGDGQKALQLVLEIAEGTNNGRMIGNGCRHTGEQLGVARIPTVKGQCLSGYDPRVLKGTGVTYATSTMGADHTCGNALPSPANPDYDPSAAMGQAPVSQFLQYYFAAIDTLGLCLFAALPPLDMPELQKHLIDCVSVVLDESLEEQYLMRLGGMVNEEERKFNKAAGFGRLDDRLPAFFQTEALSPGGNRFDVADDELDTVHK